MIKYSFIRSLKCHLSSLYHIVCKFFVVKFVVILPFSLHTHTHTHTKRINRNSTQLPLSEWKMLKLLHILQKKKIYIYIYIQIDVTRIWLVPVKQYNKWHVMTLLNKFFLLVTLVYKTYIVKFEVSLFHSRLISHIKR